MFFRPISLLRPDVSPAFESAGGRRWSMAARPETPADRPTRGRPGWTSRARRLLAALFVLAATLHAEEPIRIRIGIEVNSPPLAFEQKDGQPGGFTVELLQEIARAGAIEFEFMRAPWRDLSAAFTSGQIDALANVVATDARRATMEFSISHATLHGTVYTRPDTPSVTQAAQFAGRKIAMLRGSIAVDHALRHQAWGGEVVLFNQLREMLTAVKDGQCDAALALRPFRYEIPGDLGLRRGLIPDIAFPFRIALRRDDHARLERLNDALATVRQSEAFDQLHTKWIGPLEPRPIHLADLRPFALPVAAGLLGLTLLFAWQRWVNRALARQAAALHASEEKYRVVVQNAQEAIFVVQDGVFRFVNTVAMRLAGLSEAQLLERDHLSFSAPETHAEIRSDHQRLLAGEITQTHREHVITLPGKGRRWLEIKSVGIVWHGRPATLSFATDVTAAKQAEQERRDAAERLRIMGSRVPGFVYQYRQAPEGTTSFPYASDGIANVLHLTATEVQSSAERFHALLHPDDVAGFQAAREESARRLEPWRQEFRVVFPAGGLRWISCNALPLREESGAVRWHGFMNDVTERREADTRLHQSLREKEALLKEVHHRVKNNLQVVSSLLRLEAGRTTEGATRTSLQEMNSRIRTMALLHETLYRSGDFGMVDLPAYLRQLATQIFRSGDRRAGNVELRLELAPARIELDRAIPCGLIVNELLTNALKHGFADGRSGAVHLRLSSTDADSGLRLEVSDTGIGLPTDFDTRRTNSLGIHLVSDLARQIGGELRIHSGSRFEVQFSRVRSGPIVEK